MSYIFREKLNLLDLVGKEKQYQRVLTVGMEDYLGELYGRYLASHNLAVAHCASLDTTHEHIEQFQPHLVVLSLEQVKGQRPLLSLLYQIKLLYPSLLVVSVGYNTDHELLRKMMSAGVCSHLDRRLSRPQDLVAVVTTLLYK